MSMIAAAELKRRGIAALAPALEQDGEAVITVRGKGRYVVVTMEAYNRLRHAELDQAVRETRADYEAGRISDTTVAGHLKRLRDHV